MPIVQVTTTYLEIATPDRFRPVTEAPSNLQVMEAKIPQPDYYRFLYGTVGRDYRWIDRLGWTDERLYAYLSRPSVSLHVLYVQGTPAGYVELERESAEPGTEVAYFGLIPQFQGRGLGRYLLSYGVGRAFADGAARVWVHTCTLDGPTAMATYQGRGFTPYKQTTHEQQLPE
jgi:GNAT superfamily N-acetyltransferase